MKAYQRKSSSRPLLTVGLIAKNEEENIENCLKALMPLKEALGAQILVGDTGSTDRTVEIAQQYADEVFHVEWNQDFAAARNAVMDRGIGEWYLSVDADEWLDDPAEIIEFFKSGEYKKYASASVIINNFLYAPEEVDHKKVSPFTIMRMCRLEPSRRYVGKIHEALPCVMPMISLDRTLFTHYGYYYEGEEGALKKKARDERNHELLLNEIAQEPLDLRLNTHFFDAVLTQEEGIEFADKMRTMLQEHPELLSEHKRNNAKLSYLGLLIDKMTSMWFYNQSFDKIIETAELLVENYPESLYCASVLRKLVLAKVASRSPVGLKEEFFRYLDAVEYTQTHSKNNPEKMFGLVNGCDQSDLVSCAVSVCETLIQFLPGGAGQTATNVDFTSSLEDISSILETIDPAGLNDTLFQQTLALCFKVEDKGGDSFHLLQKCQDCETDPRLQKCLTTFWQTQIGNQSEKRMRLIARLETSSDMMLKLVRLNARAHVYYQDMAFSEWNSLCSELKYSTDGDRTFYAYALGIAAFALNQALPVDVIDFPTELAPRIGDVVLAGTETPMEVILPYVESVTGEKTLCQQHFELTLLYAALQKETAKQEDFSAAYLPGVETTIDRAFRLMIALMDSYLHHAFSPKLFEVKQDLMSVLPIQYRFGYYMVCAQRALESGDLAASLRFAKTALSMDINMKHLVRWFQHRPEFSAPARTAAPSAASAPVSAPQSAEFAALAAQFRPKIEALIRDGHTQECLPLLQQYVKICPNDAEMAALLRKLNGEPEPEPAPQPEQRQENPEFQALAAQFRSKIEVLASTGHQQECLPLLQQYLTICPNDSEMRSLLEKLNNQ